MVFVTSAAPLRVGPRGRDSVHKDCISTDTHWKKGFLPFPHLSLLTGSTCTRASVADS